MRANAILRTFPLLLFNDLVVRVATRVLQWFHVSRASVIGYNALLKKRNSKYLGLGGRRTTFLTIACT